ncbi:hypothetical protein BJ165DRAFT_860537 [Panaeolus papilionaceus]|nr:hypothetical protein BJ165DRAFT_860537 [Panaeolus papilionaceus]
MSGHSEDLKVDWRNGSVVVSNGRIFVSPNSLRRNIVLPADQTSLASPFHNHNERNLTVRDFSQPVWWNDCWGWIGFTPLSPSFLANPFQCLSWKPRTHEVDVRAVSGHFEKRCQMTPDEVMTWMAAENKIIQACHTLRLTYKIPGEMPPRPSELGFPHAYKSTEDVNSRVKVCRDWFVIWMGFLSYLVCMSQHPHHSRVHKDVNKKPAWYVCLQKAGVDHVWLEGLIQSLVCNFDKSVPRNGVILKLSEGGQANVQWLLKHNIPVWFLFDSKEEQWLQNHRFLRALVPPQFMVNDALTELFHSATPDVKAIIMVHYLNSDLSAVGAQIERMLRVRELSTDTFQFCYQAMKDEDISKLPSMATPSGREAVLASLQSAVTQREQQLRMQLSHFAYPWPQLLDRGDFQDGQLYEHWSHFFLAQSRRHVELQSSESVQDRQRRLARERQRATVKCVVYRWKKVVTGGKLLYARIRVNCRNQEDVLHSFFKKPPSTRRFNAFPHVPEWDLYEHFDDDETHALDGHIATGTWEDESDVSGSDDGQTPEELWNEVYGSMPCSNSHPEPRSPSPVEPSPLGKRNNQLNHDENDEIDVVEYMSTIFGYTPVLDRRLSELGLISWGHALKLVGLPDSLVNTDSISANDKVAITRLISQLTKGHKIEPELDDLNPSNRRYIASMFDLNRNVIRVEGALYIFTGAPSPAVDWLLAVKGASAALLVLRMMLSNRNNTTLTVACRLLEMGVAFQTLLRYPEARLRTRNHSVATSEAVYLNPCGRIFDHNDYESYRATAQQLLSRPFSRAALTRGGLIGRIARQYLGFDAVVNGPSSEVRVHFEGCTFPSEAPGTEYGDDHLTDQEVQILIGTYYMETKQANQQKVVSWLPPLTSWYESKKTHHWTQWTELDEDLFQLIMEEIRNGMQPKSRNDWRSWIRAKRAVKMANVYSFLDHFTERNECFMRENLILEPVGA